MKTVNATETLCTLAITTVTFYSTLKSKAKMKQLSEKLVWGQKDS